MSRRAPYRPAAEKRIRLNRARRAAQGWPYCEHDGAERIVGTAADHVVAIQAAGFLPSNVRVLVGGIESCAAATPPGALIGVCPDCLCMTWQGARAHRAG